MASDPKHPREAKDRGAALGLRQDRLNKKQLKALYEITTRQLRVNPKLFGLFQKAYDEQWNQARWDSEVEQLPWYRKTQASAREYAMLQAEGGADWEAKRKDSFEFVRRSAMSMGVNLSNEQLWDLTEKSMMFGWGEPGQEYELKQAIVESTPQGQYGGDIKANEDALFALSLANGVKYDPTWYQSAAKSIASGMSLAEDWETQIREQAASKFPIFAEQIRTGVNVSDLMSPYKNLMAEEWEINPADILLDDPTLLSSLMTDEKGQQSQMNMGEFTRMLRKDPRWMETDKAQNKVSSMAAGVMQMFGLTG